MSYTTTPISVSVHRVAENPIYGEGVITVTVLDEAGGPFIKLQANDYPLNQPGYIQMDADQLELIAKVARELVTAHEQRAIVQGFGDDPDKHKLSPGDTAEGE